MLERIIPRSSSHEEVKSEKFEVKSIIEYYDDEELDAYKNIDENKYKDAQIDEFTPTQ